MDQIWQGSCCLLKRNLRKWLIWAGENAVVGNTGVRDLLHVPLLHVAPGTVVRRCVAVVVPATKACMISGYGKPGISS
jgi:hypothetical protein